MVYVGSYCGSLRGVWRMAGVDVRIVMRVVLQMQKKFLVMRYVLMIGVDLLDYMSVFSGVLRCSGS